MNEQTTLEIIAPTVEEAIAQGLAQLGLTADAVSIEVVDSGSKGLFGLGGRQVRVRLSVNPPPAPPAPKVEKIEKFDRPQNKPTPPARKEPAPQKPAREQKESAPQKAPRQQKESKPARSAPAPKKEPAQESPVPAPRKIERAEHDPVLDATESVVAKLINYLGMKAQVSAHYDETSTDDRRIIQVEVRGDDLSALIGKRAETLNAFQYVASLIVGKETQQWVQLTVDVEGYRSRREKQVKQIALRMADQVIKTGRRATLEPMPANERRAIHIELRNHPAVTTESTGEDPHRKVVIVPKK
jgi:spoIIIJ-associated protein